MSPLADEISGEAQFADPFGLEATLGDILGAGARGAARGGAKGGGAGWPGIIAGAAIGAGAAIYDVCNEKPKCTLRFVREVYWSGDTKACLYQQDGSFGMFTFPQWKAMPCYPVDLKACKVDTSTMDPSLYGK